MGFIKFIPKQTIIIVIRSIKYDIDTLNSLKFLPNSHSMCVYSHLKIKIKFDKKKFLLIKDFKTFTNILMRLEFEGTGKYIISFKMKRLLKFMLKLKFNYFITKKRE
jgi:hypothetical protein